MFNELRPERVLTDAYQNFIKIFDYLPKPSLITEAAKTADMISITNKVILVEEIEATEDGFGESSDQKSLAL